jgi:hypothetical protein
MNIRFMVQNQLMQGGFNLHGSSNSAPWQNNTSGTAQNTASNASLRNAGRAVQDVFGDMRRNNVFNAMEGRSSDTDVATVRVENSRSSSIPLRDTSIDVRQAAASQENRGSSLAANERAVDAGTYNFAIESGGRTHTFRIEVGADDDNRAIQLRMAEAVNARDIGVRASVETAGSGNNRTTQLSLTGTQTGRGNAFSVSDSGGGNLASEMGISQVSREAQNALFSINGGTERESASNEINIGSGVTATLQGEGTAEITYVRDTRQAVDSARELVNALNSALRNTNANDGRGSSRFVSDIQGMNRAFSNTLSRVGITMEQNGQLTIDQARLERAAADGSLSRVLDGQSGFGARANRIATSAASGAYRNSPAPVNVTSPNHFNFGNVENMWSMMNLFG